ncbi:4-alpha-glucanotransferase [Chitinophaga silvatica]|nr:4-alpha-glucanotransferase [Chitinophaga silvatica]
MKWLNDDWWYAEINVPPNTIQSFSYQYFLQERAETTYDGIVHHYNHLDAQQELVFIDSWMDASDPRRTWISAPFTRVFFQRPQNSLQLNNTTHIFKVQAPLLPVHQTVCIMGSDLPTGYWNTEQPLLMHYDSNGWFAAAINLNGRMSPLAYKYGIYDTATQQFIRYEEGANRILNTIATTNRQTIMHDGYLRVPITEWKGAGVSVPVFSLRSDEGFGTGEFADLPLFARWVSQRNLQLIQLLPVNDTIQTHSWLDSYPYAAISSFALHPMYIRLQDVGKLPDNHLLEKQFNRLRKWLNEKEEVDYETVVSYKLAYLRALHELENEKLQTPAYWDWFDVNEHWLLPYAVFCALRNRYQTAKWKEWPEYQRYDATIIYNLLTADKELGAEVNFYFYVQFHLHLQLKKAVEEVHKQGIALKGDIPIGVARWSADTWKNPEAFNLDMQAGAPPDLFAKDGQNWGFPTYNWEVMLQDDLTWWKQRLQHMSVYFDAFRLDHVLGFFRIWQIPETAIHGILGYFHPAIPISKEEILQRNIAFEEDRFCMPYITDRILEEAFGNYAGIIRDELMEPLTDGRYRLVKYSTQKDVVASTLPDAIKSVLLNLLTDVLFIKVKHQHKNQYHPRYQLSSTNSFTALDLQTQQQLKNLYNDYFYNRQESIWQKSASTKLPLIRSATNMLISGEDLGVVPNCLPGVMKSQGLLSMMVERMPKTSNTVFSDISQASYLTVLTPSTHDMSTLRGWWEEEKYITSKYYNEVLEKTDEAPEILTAALMQEIIDRHTEAPAILRIFQLQDLLAASGSYTLQEPEKERINIPANPNHYWRYRMPVDITRL